MASHKGWTKGGSVEAAWSAFLLMILLAVDLFTVYLAIMGNPPALELYVALLALNVSIIVMLTYWLLLVGVRRGMWTRFYPLADTTLLDSIVDYFKEKGVTFTHLGESHVFMDSYSEVLRATKHRFSVKLRPVWHSKVGTLVLIGPMAPTNEEMLMQFMEEFDEVVEIDLREGIKRASGRMKDEEE